MRTSSFAIGLGCLFLAGMEGAARADQPPLPRLPAVSAPPPTAPPSRLAQCASIEGGTPALEAIDAETRLEFVRRIMRDQGVRADRWRWGWSAVGFVLAAGQYALIPFYPANQRFEQAFAGTASLYLPLSLAVFPLRIQHYSDLIERAAVDAEAAQGHMMPCLVLDRAEDQLILAAADEASLTSALMQVATVVLSIGYGAIFAFGFKDLVGTLENGIGALVLGEAQFFTTPRGAVRALERYRRGDLSGAPAVPPKLFSISMAPLGVAPGISLVATF